MRVIFSWKRWKFNADSKNVERNSKEKFCFWDKCNWIVWIQLSLLIRAYLSSAVNVLRKRLKNFHVSKSDSCNSIIFKVITEDDKRALIKIESVLRPDYHVACPGVHLNGAFSAFIYARLLWSVILEIHKLWGWFFFWNIRNIMQIWKMQKKIHKKFFLFEIDASELFAFNCLY